LMFSLIFSLKLSTFNQFLGTTSPPRSTLIVNTSGTSHSILLFLANVKIARTLSRVVMLAEDLKTLREPATQYQRCSSYFDRVELLS
jgi:hypothetical protein